MLPGEPSPAWHSLAIGDICTHLTSDPLRGLDADEALRRLARFGPNRLTPQRGTSALRRFLEQFRDPLVLILLAAGIATLFVKDVSDALTIFGVVLINAIVGFAQEARAEKALAALADTLSPRARVIRAGVRLVVPSEALVPGDLVWLEAGDQVPADLRLVQTHDLQIAEAALTGESLPAIKTADRELPASTALGDRENLAYASTWVTSGEGSGLVVATGDRSEVGRIAHWLGEAETLRTPLTLKLETLGEWLLRGILALAALVFAVGMLRGETAGDMLLAAIALAVGAIPEGLPAAVTITLAVGVSRMARRRAIIRKLPAVETLGSTTVICSDKTGTLTRNQMTVQHIHAGGITYRVSGAGYAPAGEIQPEGHDNAALHACLEAGRSCNNSSIVREGERWVAHGDPTEAALLVVAAEGGLHADIPERLGVLSFASERQCMATLHRQNDGTIAFVKGSLEAVLSRSTNAFGANGHPIPLDRAGIEAEAERFAGLGLRVLALARKTLPAGTAALSEADIDDGLCFLGLQAMLDPPRPEAIVAVAACRTAGIQVKMITGDHALTALAIARQIGLGAADGELRCQTGPQLAEMDDSALAVAAEQTDIFARVAPEQKLRLVRALQHQGHVVAMTGDGINDAPALKQANIGVAMGQTGSDVAKEAAAMVLTDDNFASIEAAVEEGRCVLDNLRKFLVWALPANIGIGLIVVVGVLAGVPLPILPAQILWINMTTAGALGLVLALEPREPGIMLRPPRPPGAPLLSGRLLTRVLFASALILFAAFAVFHWELARGTALAAARTTTVNVIVLVQLFYLINCRSLTRSAWSLGLFGNRWLLIGAGLMLGLQAAFTYLKPMQTVFSTAGMTPNEWGIAILCGLATFAIIEIEKRLAPERA